MYLWSIDRTNQSQGLKLDFLCPGPAQNMCLYYNISHILLPQFQRNSKWKKHYFFYVNWPFLVIFAKKSQSSRPKNRVILFVRRYVFVTYPSFCGKNMFKNRKQRDFGPLDHTSQKNAISVFFWRHFFTLFAHFQHFCKKQDFWSRKINHTSHQ